MLNAEHAPFDGGTFVSKIAEADLESLARIAAFDFSVIPELCGSMPGARRIKTETELFEPERGAQKNFPDASRFAELVHKNGAGEFSKKTFFYWDNGKITGAHNADPVTLRDLSGYDGERQVIIANTKRFLESGAAGGANNLLLYGDRGTGKSATVKAVCNEFARSGLRLIEVRKNDFDALPEIMSALSRRGPRFILFIDDLSFEAGDGAFTTLKALLEGGIETKPSNVVIYATSNRRHFVKEQHSDRPSPASDVRAFDTMQEQLSLADRFGITVIFSSPSQDEYLKIAEFIAKKEGALGADADEAALKTFRDNALRWERWFNGRSPRTAQQYVRWLSGGEGFPWE
jgi:predicted AAA+ superfamily ATPase